MATVAEMITAVRDAGMAIQQIADTLGVSLPTVYAWARGSSNPRAGMLTEIAALYENVVQGNPTSPVGSPSQSGTESGNDAPSQLLVPVAAFPAPAQPRRTRAASVAAEATPPPDRLAVAPPRQTGEAFRFIHCADLHLDSPLKGLAKHDDARASRIQTATRRAFKRLVNMAIDNDVGFIVISGDLYDGQWQGMDTGYFMRGQLQRLAEKEIPLRDRWQPRCPEHHFPVV
jgi:transcriptional regulator with XRE-family HTH domain